MRFHERMKGAQGTKYKIAGRRGFHSDDRDMALWFNRKGASWPDEGVPTKELVAIGHVLGQLDRWEVPIKVWVEPKANKPTFIRVKCECPGCHKVVPVGRLHQHICKAGLK